MKNAYKRWAIGLLAGITLLLGVCAAVVYRVDPFCYYRMPADWKPVFFDERSQAVAFVKHAPADTVLLGTSMGANYRAGVIAETFGGTAARVTLPDGYLSEFDAAMDIVQNNPHHCYNVGEHILHSLTHVRNDKVLRLTMLFHDLGKARTRTTDEEGIDHFHGHVEESARIADDIMKRLRFDNDTRNKVVKLVKYHDLDMALTSKGVRKAIVKLSEELFPLFIEVQRADYLAQSMYKRDEKEAENKEIQRLYEQILEEQNCVSLKTLAITGSDLIEAGMKPGKEIGEVLQKLLEEVLEEPSLNTKDILLKKAEPFIKK